MVFYSVKKLSIKDIHAKFSIPNLPQSPKSDGGISDFRISGQTPYKQKLS